MAGKQVHISEMVYLKNILRINVFYLFQTFMLIQAWMNLKAEEKALGEGGIKDSGKKIVPLLSQHEDVHIWVLFSLLNSYQTSQQVL